ncbi:hypothetical protein C8R44DRAFT_865991 [Mycena epipterygia]|nr:hypothetical protein C8R44DRAFT_865991 [Mycena epipterygia]
MAPPLPYTGPPPLNRRPRYSNQTGYPDLTSSGSSQGPIDPRYWNPVPAGSREGSIHTTYSTPSFPASSHPSSIPGEYSLAYGNTHHSNVPPVLNQRYDYAHHHSSARMRPPLTQPATQPPSAEYRLYDSGQFFGDMSEMPDLQ